MPVTAPWQHGKLFSRLWVCISIYQQQHMYLKQKPSHLVSFHFNPATPFLLLYHCWLNLLRFIMTPRKHRIKQVGKDLKRSWGSLSYPRKHLASQKASHHFGRLYTSLSYPCIHQEVLSSCYPLPWSAGIFKDLTHPIRQRPFQRCEKPPALLHILATPDRKSPVSPLERVHISAGISENVLSAVNGWAHLAQSISSPDHHWCLHTHLQPAGTLLQACLLQSTQVQQNKGSHRRKRHTTELHGMCTHRACPQQSSFQPNQPTAGDAVRLQRLCQTFVCTLTPCKWAPASRAWSMSNPNGSVEVWKPIWAFLYIDIRQDERTTQEQTCQMLKVWTWPHLCWPGKYKPSPF